MTNEDVKKIRGAIREEVGTALKPINTGLTGVENRLTGVEKKLDILWEQTDELTKDMNGVEETLKSHTNALKQIVINTTNTDDNIKRLDKRLTEAEKSLGLVPHPESNII